MGANEIQGVLQTLTAIGGLRDRINGAVKQTITELTFTLVARVKEQKLSDQVLRVRTGRLRRSITGRVTEEAGQIVGIVGTNVEYARRHEYGFNGTVNVRAYMRTAKTAFGRQLKAPVTFRVSAHPRAVNLPERSFLRSALGEMQPDINAKLAAAIREAAHA